MRLSAILASAILLSTAIVPAASAQEDEHVVTVGAITVEHPWARAAAAGGDTLAFLEIENAGAADRIVAMRTDVATSVTLVGLAIANGVIEMVPVGDFDLPAGAFAFDPGGLGLALTGLTRPLVEGEEFELTLTLATAGDITVHVLVEAADAVAHSHAH